jgi:PAS domain S-box-containing protein
MGVILIAYERESEQNTLDTLLSGRGHRIVRSANGLAALDAARREPPQLVVSDIVLPRMDGFALCRKWKQDERLQSIPFIFYTRRHDDPKYERFALELGAERFLARSVQPDALLTAIDELLLTSKKANETMPLPALDTVAIERAHERAQAAAALEKVHLLENTQQQQAQLIERAQQMQANLRAQLGELEGQNQRLAAGEARFRRIFEANPLPMWIVDCATGGFIAVNDAALAMYGYSRAEFLALRTNELSGKEPAATAAGITTHRGKQGAELKLSVATREIEFDGRRAELVSAYDLTARIAAESQVREQSAAGRKMMEAVTDGFLLLDTEGRILDANAAYCRLTGYERDALLKMTAGDLEHHSSGETTTRLQLTRASGNGRYEVKHKRHDGTFVEVEVSVGSLDDERSNTVMLVRDVSQRRREQIAQRIGQRQLEFLVDLFRQADSFDEIALIRRMVEQACDATRSPLAYLFFVQPADKTMTLAAWRDRGQGHVTVTTAESRPIAKSSLFYECVRARHPTSSNDLSWKPQADGLPDLQRYLAVPMSANDETVAVLGVGNREAGYNEEDQRALVALADGVWRVLQNKRAHAQTLSSLQRVDVALQGMIDALLKLSERHDPYTAGSARRVAALAVAIGREAGLDGERQHALRVAALLHDVGNVAIPPSLLAKPGALNEAEAALMRTHVEEGCKLLADIDFGAPIAEIVFEHHERLDGSGYPRKLKGEEIRIEARILAIADVVEAMCSPRPYRPACGIDAALDEITRGAGVLYDLHLATACTRLFRQHGFTLPE